MAIDANTGEVLYSSAGDELRFPASLTKMMTLYLAFEAIEQGRTSFTRTIKVSQEAASAAPTKLDLDPGEEIALIDAIKALITKSANDMAIAVAEHLAGSEAKFAQLMTDKARAIGMTKTTFHNASGLPDPGQLTTARDMLILAMRLQDDFPKHYPLFALKSFTYNGSTHRNHNTLLGAVEGIDGIKTGYTRMSGYNVVTNVRRGDKHVVAAVFGGLTAGIRNVQMRLLLARVLPKASSIRTRKSQPMLIARPKLAPRPEPAQRAQPTAVAAVAPPPAIAPAATSSPPRPRPITLADANALMAAEPPLRNHGGAKPAEPPVRDVPVTQPPTVEIAKVRRVMVAPRVRPAVPVEAAEPAAPAPPAIPAETAIVAAPTVPAAAPKMPAAAPPPPVAHPAAARFATPTRAPQPTIAEQRRTQVASLRTASLPIPPAPAAGVRGALPSTLQAQAESLARGGPAIAPQVAQPVSQSFAAATAAPQPAYQLRGPSPVEATLAPARTPFTGAFMVQIGAFNSAAEADRALAAARERAQDLIGAFAPVNATAQKENRQIYRARFAGFDARTAASTCLALRRRQIDCFVMKAE